MRTLTITRFALTAIAASGCVTVISGRPMDSECDDATRQRGSGRTNGALCEATRRATMAASAEQQSLRGFPTASELPVSPPPPPPLEPGTYQRQGETVETSWGVQFLGFLPLAFASTKEAVQKATMDGSGHALADVTVDNTYYNWLIFTAQRIKVEGTAVTTY